MQSVIKSMAITVKDIANHVNLSQPTVSRILSGDPNQRVAAATRQRVIDAAKKMRYQPNAVARSLRLGRTDVIGIYTNHDYDARNDFYGTLLGVLQRSCERNRLDLLIHSALHERPVEDMYAKLRDGRVDGLILHASPEDPLVPILQRSSLPVVAVADTLPMLPSVAADDKDGIRQSIEYLLEQGYTRFAYLCPQQELPASIELRMLAFQEELAARGVEKSNLAVYQIDWEDPERAFEQGLFQNGQVAVCCWNDRTAYKLLNRCIASNLRVPQDIAVVGFDGFVSNKVPAYQLVTVECPWEDVVNVAFKMLIEMINGEHPRSLTDPVHVRLPVSLIKGDTA